MGTGGVTTQITQTLDLSLHLLATVTFLLAAYGMVWASRKGDRWFRFEE
jgi:hypothetical protein